MSTHQHHLRCPQPPVRPFSEIYVERSYLFNSLQLENVKASDLLRQIAQLEETLVLNSAPARKVRKQVGWLKGRLRQTTCQERIIMARLDEISWEIQEWETWGQIGHERIMESQTECMRHQEGIWQLAAQESQVWTFAMPQWNTDYRQELSQQNHTIEGDTKCYVAQPVKHQSWFEATAETDTDKNILSPNATHDNPTTREVSNCSRPSLAHRSSSLGSASLNLDLLPNQSASSDQEWTPMLKVKCNSLPSLPDMLDI